LHYKRSDNFKRAKKDLVGIDVFVQEDNRTPAHLAEKLISVIRDLPLELQMITNRGVKVWPQGLSETFCTDHWRCRMVSKDGGPSDPEVNWRLMKALTDRGIDVIKCENLYLFDGEKGYSLGQGQ
jgi:isocitrate dehydrogenase